MERLTDVHTLTPAHWSPHLFFMQQHELCVWRQTQKVGIVGHYRPIVLEDHCYWITGGEAEKLRSCGKNRQTLFSGDWKTAVGRQNPKKVLNRTLMIRPRIIRFMLRRWTNLLILDLTLECLLWLMLFFHAVLYGWVLGCYWQINHLQ